MTDSDTTFSEELTVKRSWREWIRENRLFLIVIGILSLTSIVLLFYDLWQRQREAHSQHQTLEKQPLPALEPTPLAIPKMPKKKIKANVISEATRLFEEGKIDQAISMLLQHAHGNPEAALREQAAALAKKLHTIQKEKDKLRKEYLEGYVLFQTYPQKACEKWADILDSTETSDIYYQKAKRRWENECERY